MVLIHDCNVMKIAVETDLKHRATAPYQGVRVFADTGWDLRTNTRLAHRNGSGPG